MILMILGVPDVNLSQQVLNEENIASVSRKVEEFAEDLESIASDAADTIDQTVAEVSGEMPEDISDKVVETATMIVAELSDDELNATEVLTVPPTRQDDEIAANETAGDDVKWHAFWNPFRSRLAAEGFVGQLEKVTGLDYRVVKIKTGVYEVTFAYENDDERREKISLIASAAGLDLPDS